MDNEKDMSPVNNSNDELGRMEKIENWLTNTFWFHYKWYFIIGVFLLSLLIMAAVGLVTSVSYDWTVVYAHNGAADSARAEEIRELMESLLPETGKNRRVDVEVVELSRDGGVMESYGENLLYSHLNDQNTMIYILDEENYHIFSELGYFADAVAVSAMPGLYCTTNDSPVKPLDAESPEYADYSQEFLDDVYLEYVAEHEELLAKAREALSHIN
ncbi:MAG: hypothetical protein PUB32_01700 [Clostridiales bacterium]|nr:hypothetical protein [Clostridiales bacterium]